MRVSVFLLCLLPCVNVFAADCPRNYPTGIKNYEVRLVSDSLTSAEQIAHWQIGIQNASHQWTALSCDPNLDLDFFNGTNGASQDEHGVGHIGKTASFVFYPITNVDGFQFFVNPQNLFGTDRFEIKFPELGSAFLNKTQYQEFETNINGLSVVIDSEPANPAKSAAIKTLEAFTKLFPRHTKAMNGYGKVNIVLARNSTEGFQPSSSTPLRPNGIHDARYLYSILFSEDGTYVLEHSFHEIGGLFRVINNKYSHGLTWMAAFDQIDKLNPSGADQKTLECWDLEDVITRINQSAMQPDGQTDFSHTIEYYIERNGEVGYPMYAWGSGYYWKLINTKLEELKLSNVYELIDSIPNTYGPQTKGKLRGSDLDKWLAAYLQMNPSGAPIFKELVTKYFRKYDLAVLLGEAVHRQTVLGCQANH